MGGATSTEEANDKDKNHPDNKALVHEGWKNIKEKKRRSTDCLLTLLLLGTWLTMTLIGFTAIGIVKSTVIQQGNPAKLIHATDYKGRTCGTSSGVTSKKNGYYLADGKVVCVKSCPSLTIYDEVICEDEYQSAADNSTSTRATYVSEYKCLFKIKTKNVLNRCIPQISASEINEGISQEYNSTSTYSASTSTKWFSGFIEDIYNNSGIVFGFGIGVSTAIAFLYLYILRIPGFLFLVIWTLLLTVQVLFLVFSFLLWSLSNSWNHDGKHTSYEVLTMRVFAYTGMGVSVLYFALLLVMRKRVQLAIGVVKEAAKAVATMPMLMIMPIFQAIGMAFFMVPWIIYVIYLASSGEITTTLGTYYVGTTEYTYYYKEYSYASNTKYAFIFMLFCWFWTSEFIIAVGQLVIALSLVAWYFTHEKKSIGNGTVIWAFKTVARYHAGTAAFGSLLLAIILTIRAIIAYFQRQAKKSGNFLMKYLLCILQCFMWCLEKCIRFLNKNAYIQTAIHGYSFCKSARVAFFLLLRNILRVSAVNIVADFLLLLGKLIVTASTVFICYLVLAYGGASVNGIVSPLVFVALLAYFIATMFSEIFGMGIETILCCYIADEEMFSPAERYGEGGLKSAIQTTAQAAGDIKVVPVEVSSHTLSLALIN